MWGCASGPVVLSRASYLSNPPIAVNLEKIQIIEHEDSTSSSNTLLDVNIVDVLKQWTKSAFECSGSGTRFNIEITEAKLVPLREIQKVMSAEDENVYVGILGVRIFMGRNPLSSQPFHSIHSKVSITIPDRYTLKDRRQMVVSLAEEVVDILHKEVMRYLETQQKLRR